MIAGLLTVLLLLGLGLGWWATAPPHRIGAVAEDIHAVRAGLTLPEVTAMIGVPPGDYTSPVVLPPVFGLDPNGNVPPWRATADWRTDESGVRVYLDSEGRVLFARCVRRPVVRLTPWERFRRTVGL